MSKLRHKVEFISWSCWTPRRQRLSLCLGFDYTHDRTSTDNPYNGNDCWVVELHLGLWTLILTVTRAC